MGRLIGLIIGFSLHEWGHAWSAYQLGDTTAYLQGRLTLNPRAHIEPWGLILALLAGFGWAKPVPVNPFAFYPNEKRGLVLVSLAGPVMNIIVALAVSVPLRLMAGAGADAGFFFDVVETIIYFNLFLCFFNLIPLSPLDGYKIAVGTLPNEYSDWFVKYERETNFTLMLIILIGVMGGLSPLGAILSPPVNFLFDLFTGL
jgi:Zn-dependent protease